MPTAIQRRTTAGDRATLAALTEEICACKAHIGRRVYDIGIRLTRIRDQELWRSGGYDGFDDYLERAVAISRRSAYRFMRIARHFNAEIARRYGSEKLDAALRYLQMTPEDEQPGDLLATQIRIRDRAGRFTTVPLHQATAKQIHEAIAVLRDAKRAGHRIPTKVRRRIERLNDALPPAPKGTSRGDRVRITRGKDGDLALSFSAIALDDLDAFIALLREHLRGAR